MSHLRRQMTVEIDLQGARVQSPLLYATNGTQKMIILNVNSSANDQQFNHGTLIHVLSLYKTLIKASVLVSSIAFSSASSFWKTDCVWTLNKSCCRFVSFNLLFLNLSLCYLVHHYSLDLWISFHFYFVFFLFTFILSSSNRKDQIWTRF